MTDDYSGWIWSGLYILALIGGVVWMLVKDRP
jgi:hypothetical protein